MPVPQRAPAVPSQGLQRLQPVMEESAAEVDSPAGKRHRSRRQNITQVQPLVSVPPFA